jgi:hypothetical protein
MSDDYTLTPPVTIALNGSLSGAVRLAGMLLVGLVMPAAWDAANLTFQGSIDNVTFNNVYDDAGTEKTAVAAASRHLLIVAADFAGIEWLKVRSGTAGTPVVQTAARTITLVVRPA